MVAQSFASGSPMIRAVPEEQEKLKLKCCVAYRWLIGKCTALKDGLVRFAKLYLSIGES